MTDFDLFELSLDCGLLGEQLGAQRLRAEWGGKAALARDLTAAQIEAWAAAHRVWATLRRRNVL